jgi:hypothetical protein
LYSGITLDGLDIPGDRAVATGIAAAPPPQRAMIDKQSEVIYTRYITNYPAAVRWVW